MKNNGVHNQAEREPDLKDSDLSNGAVKAPPKNGKADKVPKSQPTQAIQAYKIGSKDFSGHTITDILSSGNEYIIYEIETNDISGKLRVFVDGFDDKREARIVDDFCDVKNKYIIAKGLLYKSENAGTMKNRVATALSTALHGDPVKANEQFDQLIHDIKDEYRQANESRILYMLPGYLLMALFTFILGVNAAFHVLQVYLLPPEIFNWMAIAFAAVIGGVFSLTLSLPNIHFDTETNGWMFFLHGIERISISILAGIICVSGIKAQLILPDLSRDQNKFWVLFFIVIIAAFSEKMIPNILGKISDKDKASEQSKTSGQGKASGQGNTSGQGTTSGQGQTSGQANTSGQGQTSGKDK